ncbi:MAG: hypothetical protein JO152_07105 [Mycobacteriaceae bacterium]|nr:hypothetical protein [Mycobacteriaceae bacterium]
MASALFPNLGLQEALKLAIGKATNPVTTFRLFQNDFVPDSTTTLDDFVEANFAGYLPATVAAAAFGDPVQSSPAWVSSVPPLDWSSSDPTPQTVYGVYAQSNDGTLFFCAVFDAPITLNMGDSMEVDATVQCWPR